MAAKAVKRRGPGCRPSRIGFLVGRFEELLAEFLPSSCFAGGKEPLELSDEAADLNHPGERNGVSLSQQVTVM